MNTVESIQQLLLRTGAGWVLWLLLALSVVSVAIAVERWWFYRRSTGDLPALAERLHALLREDDFDGARAFLQGSPATAARVAAAGLRLADLGPAAAEKAMTSRIALEREMLERRLTYLGTLGNNAPFVGLFGTVVGVIHAFAELGHSAVGHAANLAGGPGQVASAGVMSAIAEALVATAVGIAVALPAVAAYNYLDRRVTTLLDGTEALSNLVLAYLSRDNEDDAGPVENVGEDVVGRAS